MSVLDCGPLVQVQRSALVVSSEASSQCLGLSVASGSNDCDLGVGPLGVGTYAILANSIVGTLVPCTQDYTVHLPLSLTVRCSFLWWASLDKMLRGCPLRHLPE